ncbi:DDHD domain-containing protein [Geopyxis carbonaria]|nr:DDHD domain-containing protein [Geopyxis carbonaria]
MANNLKPKPRNTSASNSSPNTRPTNDHTLSFRHRLSQREYPPDCPLLNVRWYYAVDGAKFPKRKPFSSQKSPLKPPSKFVPFGPRDSRAIETAFQKLSDEEDIVESTKYKRAAAIDLMSGDAPKSDPQNATVAVNEDYLFDVDIKKRELAPVYWKGPVYDVRRGTWFFQEGSTLRPCDENLATQIEEGYLNTKPFRNIQSETTRPKTPTTDNVENLKTNVPISQPPTWRLFGAHLNSFVVYADPNTAWLLTDDFYGKLSSTVWQRISAGTHMGGLKIVRGYSEVKASEKKAEKETVRSVTSAIDDGLNLNTKYDSMPTPLSGINSTVSSDDFSSRSSRELGKIALERKMSSYAGDTEKMLESEMKEDYTADDESDEPGREIEHLILVTHGIGQKLSMRMESINFVHDVNVLRKSLKGVYSVSPDLQVLNNEVGDSKRKNCRLQCLPVCWRHLLDFPQQSLRQNRGEQGPVSGSPSHEEEYPSLEDITVEGVPSVRTLMTDLALDVLLYQSTTYREHIVHTVLDECNRIYALFKKRNPGFNGKISFVGHSLGSAILFDILCRQPGREEYHRQLEKSSLHLNFPVENFFCLGSPIGLFQMLKGRTISARSPFKITPTTAHDLELPEVASRGPVYPVSSPKCSQLFNIFHPTDPIAYRLEPLVSKAMAELKPQPLPYTKRGLFSANGQIVGGISGIGQTVTRNITNMWSSLSSGIATSILNRSLGFNDAMPQAKSGSCQDKKAPKEGQHPPTMIDAEIETLYSGFQKRRKSTGPSGEGATADEIRDAIREEGRLRNEENKVRALNSTGRIDFAIQEGVFDISLIASIASHLSYWGDEDVNHFIISQILSRQRIMKRDKEKTGQDIGNGWSISDVGS